jgi:hypothetical protein
VGSAVSFLGQGADHILDQPWCDPSSIAEGLVVRKPSFRAPTPARLLFSLSHLAVGVGPHNSRSASRSPVDSTVTGYTGARVARSKNGCGQVWPCIFQPSTIRIACSSKAQIALVRIRRRRADREPSADGAPRLSEHVVRPESTRVECLHDDTDERNRRADRVAERRAAAARVPAVESLRREAQAGDPIGTAIETQRGGRDLHEVAAAVGIEQIGTLQVVERGLAVIAVADGAVDGVRAGVGEGAVDGAAAAGPTPYTQIKESASSHDAGNYRCIEDRPCTSLSIF